MNIERHINRLNQMLRVELGEHPLYRWVFSESPDFRHAMRVTDEIGTPLYDYRCPCGLNAAVHSAECVAGMLVVAEPVYEFRKIDPLLENQWVLCSRQVPGRWHTDINGSANSWFEVLDERKWEQVFGSRLAYPKNGEWAPVSTETHTVACKPGEIPGERFNMIIIRARQKSREVHPASIKNAHESSQQKRDASRRLDMRQRFKDIFTLNPIPGVRGNSVSWGGTDSLSPTIRRKVQEGENLVQL